MESQPVLEPVLDPQSENLLESDEIYDSDDVADDFEAQTVDVDAEAEAEAEEDVGDDFVAVDETTASDNQFAQRIRQRAEEEHHEQLRMCPHFNYTYQDTDGFQVELEEWFEYGNNYLIVIARSTFESEGPGAGFGKKQLQERKTIINELRDDLQSRLQSKVESSSKDMRLVLICLSYVAMGAFYEASNLDDHFEQIKSNCKLLWKSDILPVLYDHMRPCFEFILDQAGSADINAKLEEVKFSMTVFYFILESCRITDEEDLATSLSELSPPILPYFTELIARLRWTMADDFPMRNVLLLFWKCILCLFGGRAKLETAKNFIKVHYNLPTTHDPDDVITASPLDYHEFREDLISRYPTYNAPVSQLNDDALNSIGLAKFIEVPRPSHTQALNNSMPPPTVHIATPAPSPPLAPIIGTGQKLRKSVFMTNQSFPFLFPTEDIGEKDGNNSTTTVPHSIVEAGELFSSRIRTTPAMIQLWNEKDKFMQHERGWSEANKSSQPWDTLDTPESRTLQRVQDYYIAALPFLSSFINVLLRLMLSNVNFKLNQGSCFEEGVDMRRTREINLKSISAILDLLSSWFKVSHVLKSEYFSTLLFDTHYYLVIYKFLYLHTPLERALENPDIAHFNFFAQCRMRSDSTFHNYGEMFTPKILPTPEMAKYSTEINSFSSRYFFTIINFIRVLRRMTKGKTQRIIVLAELPSDTLKKVLSVHQEDLYKMVLEIFKEQAPYNGRKWKYSNMDLVSAIYLHCKAKLRDDWLSGLDISGEVDDAYPQELAMRSLTQFYNNRLVSGGDPTENEDSDVEGLNLHDLSVQG
jgi:hypothetical protein